MYDYDRRAMEHSSPGARKEYLKDHPNADPKNHTVSKPKSHGGGDLDYASDGGARQTADKYIKRYGIKPGLERKVQKLRDAGSELDKLEKEYAKLNPDDRYTKQRKIEETFDEYAKLLDYCTGLKPKKPWWYDS